MGAASIAVLFTLFSKDLPSKVLLLSEPLLTSKLFFVFRSRVELKIPHKFRLKKGESHYAIRVPEAKMFIQSAFAGLQEIYNSRKEQGRLIALRRLSKLFLLDPLFDSV